MAWCLVKHRKLKEVESGRVAGSKLDEVRNGDAGCSIPKMYRGQG
jgi:hypothetical protein